MQQIAEKNHSIFVNEKKSLNHIIVLIYDMTENIFVLQRKTNKDFDFNYEYIFLIPCVRVKITRFYKQQSNCGWWVWACGGGASCNIPVRFQLNSMKIVGGAFKSSLHRCRQDNLKYISARSQIKIMKSGATKVQG